MTGRDLIEVEVAAALPDRQEVVQVRVPAGSTAIQAVEQSGVLTRFPEFDARSLELGIFGRRVAGQRVLRDGERVEIYRPLAVDPRDARRRRASFETGGGEA